MTKTHTADNEMLNAVKATLRTLHSKGESPSGVSEDERNKVMASGSLFELADAMRLGRTRTRAWLTKTTAGLTSQLEQLMKKGVK